MKVIWSNSIRWSDSTLDCKEKTDFPVTLPLCHALRNKRASRVSASSSIASGFFPWHQTCSTFHYDSHCCLKQQVNLLYRAVMLPPSLVCPVECEPHHFCNLAGWISKAFRSPNFRFWSCGKKRMTGSCVCWERSLGDTAVIHHSLVKAPGSTPHPRRTIPRQVFCLCPMQWKKT